MYVRVHMCTYVYIRFVRVFVILCALGTTWANNIVRHFPQKGGSAAVVW